MEKVTMKSQSSTPNVRAIFLWTVLGAALLAANPVLADKASVVSGPAKKLNLPDVVAQVNGVEVASNHVNFEFNRVVRENPEPLTAEQKKALASKIIDSEVVRELVYQNAKEAGTTFDKKEVEESFQLLKKQFPEQKEWQQLLDERGITEDTLRHSIEMDLMARKFLEGKVQGKIKITDAQVKNFYEENKERFRRPESYRSQHIFIAYVPADKRAKMSRDELREKAQDLRKDAQKRMGKVTAELEAGGDFSALAKKYSEDAGSSEKGGDLGFVYKGMLDKSFDDAVAGLKPGETSKVIETPYGFHVIKLNETKPAETAPFDDVKKPIQNYLFTEEAKKIVESNINLMRKQAKIEVFYKP